MFNAQYSNADRKVEDGFRLGVLCVDPASGSIEGPGGREQVDPKVMEVLLALARHPGELVTRAHLLDEVWRDRVVGDETLTQCVYQLRGHLKVAGGDAQYRKLVETLPRRGYRLGGNVEPTDPVEGRDQVVALGRRSRAGMFAVLVVAVAVAGGGFLAFQWLSAGGDAPAPQNSIAVLPFEDFSQDRDQGYLAHGFAEEMIDVLTRIPGLRVIARTSSFSFRGENLDIPAIADKLDVAYLLEGSVRKVGNEIRVTTQLVDAGSNTHLWSASFDRQLTDILAIQTEIARSVADTLHLTLSAPAISALAPPRDPEAYEHYLLGRFFWHRRAPGDEERAERQFRRAVDTDPRFARAWVGLAGAYWAQVEYSEPGRAALKKMGEALDRALAIEPDSSEAHARAAAYHRVQGNQRLYDEHWQKARELGLEPHRENWLVLSYAANHAIRRGEYERALRIMERVLEIDPLSALTYGNYGYNLMAAGRYAEAKAAFDKADEFNPAMQPEHDILRTFLLALAGRHEAAIARARDWPDSPDRDQLLAKSNYALGREEAAEDAVNRLRARPGGDTALRLAEIEASQGNQNSAFDLLASINQRAIEDENRMWPTWENRVRISPCLRPLRNNPRWESMIARLPKRPLIVLSGDGIASSLDHRF